MACGTMTHIAQSNFRIEAATIEDVPLILSFIKELAEFERLSHLVVATEEGLSDSLFGSRPKAEVVICYAGDAPVGFALFFHNYSTFLGQSGIYLEDLYVRPETRGRGAGRLLLAHLARLAVERGCGRLEWAVLDWNEQATRFYKNLGAVPMDEWTTFRLTGESLSDLAAKD